ncbi:MAG: putative transcriptional regulator [Pseudonocardiales bacterium]|jgi:putative transcriptional regulator|nr:putative transcriptional regulator [Pseudonocardiales bacterium]MDT4940465.1 putative transcriptional regulator [Pseudonocardiales bacterium]
MTMTAPDWGSLSGLEPAAGRLLVATPLLGDPHFVRTVVYLLEHDGGGTVGVVLNRPSHTPVAQVLPDWHDAVSGPAVVFGGGPVQPDGALCLGQLQPGAEGIREVVDGVSTVDLDGDVAVIAPNARRLRVFAGHAGWSPGQLEGELDEGAWWVFRGGPDDLFSDDPRTMWRQVLRRQPSPVNLLSTYPADPTLN